MWRRWVKGRRWLGGDGRVNTRREIQGARGKEMEGEYIESPLRRMERDFGRALE